MTGHVLVVEDESSIAEVLEYNLRREGFEVRIAERGDLALKAVGVRRPDLVLLDLMLPGIDGLEVLRQLRADTTTRSLPVIVLTAKAEEIDRIVGLELGADDYIRSPSVRARWFFESRRFFVASGIRETQATRRWKPVRCAWTARLTAASSPGKR